MAPAWRTAPFWGASDAMPSQEFADGFVAKRDAQFGEFAGDLEVAPVSIFARQSYNEPFNVRVGTRTTALPM